MENSPQNVGRYTDIFYSVIPCTGSLWRHRWLRLDQRLALSWQSFHLPNAQQHGHRHARLLHRHVVSYTPTDWLIDWVHVWQPSFLNPHPAYNVRHFDAIPRVRQKQPNVPLDTKWAVFVLLSVTSKCPTLSAGFVLMKPMQLTNVFVHC